MAHTDRQNLHSLSVSDGGRAREPRTHADLEFERALRALFVAMRDKEGRSLNMNFRNVASGRTTPWRGLMRRFREAKAARNDAHNYPLMKQAVREMDEWVDAIHPLLARHSQSNVTGEYPTPPRAPAQRKRA